MSYPKTSVIIVNYNGGTVLEKCLLSVGEIIYPIWELIIVDNGSTDNFESTIHKYKKNFSNIKIIRNETNKGFAPANNQGVKVATGKYILLLNNDTVVPKNLLSVMVEKMKRDETIGAMQPKIFIMDKPGFLDNAGSFITKIGFLVHWGYDQKDGKEFMKEREVFTGKGACLMIRKEVVDNVGLFDEDFVSYFEDSDFCWRVWLSGRRVIFFPKISIRHKVGYTNKRIDVLEVNFNSIKNRISSLYKNLNLGNLFLILVPHIIILLILSLYYLVKFQFNKALMIWRAVGWNLMHLKSLEANRTKAQKMRRVSDNYIFNKVGTSFDIIGMLSHFKKVEANFKK
ncbi:glycosyltransferase family 2 protein [Candidatus Woesebacteria bacterium]|nr:glycosyltransferase family 2 protein [Candidatus Woesebacteria bacterium]